jgi:hypothetical protein
LCFVISIKPGLSLEENFLYTQINQSPNPLIHIVKIFRSHQLWRPAHMIRRKQLNLHIETVDDVHIVYDTSLEDPLPRESCAGSVHRASTIGAEISCNSVATSYNLGYRFEVTFRPPAFIGDDDIHRVGAAGVFLAFAAVA